ncbi:MAG: hypothetical protein ACXAEX_06150 [Promethearchaeota archaeon]|jgi:hypothetical protein
MVYITNYFDFENNIGNEVKIEGMIAKEIWQHLTVFLDSHPYMHYFDLEDGHQIVIYTKDAISCAEEIEIIGRVIKAEGQHKNPRSKTTDDYFEYQLIVDSWKCLEGDKQG